MRVKLGDICERGSSNLKQSDVIDVKGEYPVFGAAGFVSNVDFYHQETPYVAVVKDGAGVGRTMLLPAKSSVIGTMQYLLPKSGIMPEYLYYVVKSKHLEKYFMGAAIPHIYFKDYSKEEFELFDDNKQKEVVSILQNIERIIDNKNKELKLLDELVKSRFIEQFGDCKNMFSMNDLCSIITDGTHQPPKFQADGIPFIFVSNIANNTVTYDAEKFISNETYNDLIKRTPIEIGDVLLSTVGSYGHPAVVVENRKFLFQRHIAYLKPKHEVINSFYLHSALLSPDAQRQIEEKVKGIAQKTLNLSEIRKIMIPVPNMSQQNEFVEFVEKVDKSKFIVQKSLEEAQLLSDSLMQKYFG